MPWVLQQILVADAVQAVTAALRGDDVNGEYIKTFDVNSHGGVGSVVMTPHVAEAMRFDSFSAALEAWRTQSTVRPLRLDGKPNRPLTALSISPMEVDR